ncbi:MAG: M67 family peptidase [Dehalococcoidia bacterium]|nr:M67 family peptidase [Dehalococcoidia bacterium]
MSEPLRLERHYLEEMVAHARRDDPNECCGILAGAGGRVARLWAATNSEHSPVRYNVEPKELLGIYREIENRGWDFLAVYHSHTHSPAYPSPTDIRLAEPWPHTYFIIISLQDHANPQAKAFRIVNGQVNETAIEIV